MGSIWVQYEFNMGSIWVPYGFNYFSIDPSKCACCSCWQGIRSVSGRWTHFPFLAESTTSKGQIYNVRCCTEVQSSLNVIFSEDSYNKHGGWSRWNLLHDLYRVHVVEGLTPWSKTIRQCFCDSIFMQNTNRYLEQMAEFNSDNVGS